MPCVEQLPAGSVLLQANWVSTYDPYDNQVEADEAPTNVQNQYPCQDPINPHMGDETKRIASFYNKSWNRDFLQASPEELAKAGLFFTGRSDRVKCWYCNGGLQNWDYTDSPIAEHAKWYPQCEFILREKGDEYVQKIYDQNPNLKRPRIRNGSVKFRPQQIAQDTIVAADEIPAQQQAPNDNDVEMMPVAPVQTENNNDVERIVEIMIKDSDIVKSVVDMGFELDVIRKTLTETLAEDKTFKFESRFQLVDAVLKFESS